MKDSINNEKTGVLYVALAYFMWGVLPLYWKWLDHIAAGEILAHRIFWSFVFMILLLMFNRQLTLFWKQLQMAVQNPKQAISVITAALLISMNWFIYIWAVNHEHIVETSLGYYINPLVSVALGMIVLKERLNIWQLISFILAMIGVLMITIQYGSFPWIAISLAVSFGFYGLAKKVATFDSSIGLTFETMVVTPIALLYIVYAQAKGIGSFDITDWSTLLLMGTGPATALPLLYFAKGVKRIPLTMIGFLQYIAPTITLLLGIFLFHETFTKTHLYSFSFIWAALIIFSISKTKQMELLQNKWINRNSLHT
ncbi:chloramphenicol-sensitive protein RarD [Anoxybacillus vitaminiphilus]|uniref:Chloramphenicol-sensitive protein RarD n=1 Tax=Paranoxybacillus vitaminiphilus TaxID=581036 RepID=A0A327YF45_9BACL|nr:EamA family transporter RarD [Anoxybacillus vitaminiphilus]RAK18435.1 chloramphenicol-sensitive protein RarD [Anoxybacillus vitaminiphilus]